MSDALFVDKLTELEKSIVISLLLAPVGRAPKVNEGATYEAKPFKSVLPDKDYTDMPTMKKGGSVSSASKRADGIAQRGKTRGKMV